MGFALGMKDVKLFVIVCAVLAAGMLMFLPPDNWQWFWDYLNNTPPWVVLGQQWLLWFTAFWITIFLIIIRSLRK